MTWFPDLEKKQKIGVRISGEYFEGCFRKGFNIRLKHGYGIPDDFKIRCYGVHTPSFRKHQNAYFIFSKKSGTAFPVEEWVVTEYNSDYSYEPQIDSEHRAKMQHIENEECFRICMPPYFFDMMFREGFEIKILSGWVPEKFKLNSWGFNVEKDSFEFFFATKDCEEGIEVKKWLIPHYEWKSKE